MMSEWPPLFWFLLGLGVGALATFVGDKLR